MSLTIENAFDDGKLKQPARLHSEYIVQVGDLGKEVRIKIWKMVNGTGYYFTQSHYVETPAQGGPYRTSDITAESEAEALHKAVGTFTRFYNDTVKGQAAEDSWFVKNEDF